MKQSIYEFSHDEIAEILGLTSQRVRIIEKEALSKIGKALGDLGLEL